MFTSIDVNNDPFPDYKNINYSFDGNTIDNANEGGPKLEFRNNAAFSNPGQITGQPVSPINRNANPNFQKGYYLRYPKMTIPTSGSISDNVRINLNENITDINLFIALNHENLSDLEIYLIAPNGDSVRVINSHTSNSSDNNLVTVFNDQADSTLINGRYNSLYTIIKPLNNINSVFGGDKPQGLWKLRVNDNEAGNTGILYAWGIQVNNQTERDKNLNLSCLIQGFYDANTNLMVPDTMSLKIRHKFPPYDLISTHSEVLDSLGVGRYSISAAENIVDDSFYYCQINHRNSIESWFGLITFLKYESNPNTAFSINSIVGNNVIKVDNSPQRFAIYNGDTNQDGIIDGSDLSDVENAAAVSLSGYVSTDVTGDDTVDGSDISLVDNNSALGIFVIAP